MKHNHFRSFAILFGLLLCAGACYGIYFFWKMPADGHWTRAEFAPPLTEVADRVEVFIGGEPILKVVEAQNLLIKDKEAVAPLPAEKLLAKLNNYDRDRYAAVPKLLGLAAVAGGAFVLFLVGLFAPLIKALKPPDIIDLHIEE